MLNWVRESELLLNAIAFEVPWQNAGKLGESEHDVYPESGVWFKRNNLSHHGTWLEYFHRLLLHNWLFPDTRVTLEGFVKHGNGLRPVVWQTHISAERGATQLETDKFMGNLGFVPIRHKDPARQDDYINSEAGIEVNDLHDENVLIRPDGSLAVMDPVSMMEETSKIRRITDQIRGDQ